MEDTISLFIAFSAGLLSFLSPCLLPLIPSYLCFIGGITLEKGAFFHHASGYVVGYNTNVIFGTLFFILGFSSVFIILSVIFSRVALFFGGGINRIISIVAGLIIILMGLHILFNFLGFLNYEKRFHPSKHPKNLGSCFMIGMAFGAGWTPCIGPILTGILFLASQNEQTVKGICYLAVYSLGLGLPFMGAAVFLQAFLKQLGKLKRLLPVIHRISGIFLIVLGFLIMLGRFQMLTSIIQQYSYEFVQWSQSGSIWLRFIPAGCFFVISMLPPVVIKLIRKQKSFSRGIIIFSSIFLMLCILQIAGIINTIDILAKWIVYQETYN
jgi:cytochrome c-type biogenesis protein